MAPMNGVTWCFSTTTTSPRQLTAPARLSYISTSSPRDLDAALPDTGLATGGHTRHHTSGDSSWMNEARESDVRQQWASARYQLEAWRRPDGHTAVASRHISALPATVPCPVSSSRQTTTLTTSGASTDVGWTPGHTAQNHHSVGVSDNRLGRGMSLRTPGHEVHRSLTSA